MNPSHLPVGLSKTSLSRQSKEISKSGFKKLAEIDEKYYERILAAVTNSLNPETPPQDVATLASEIGVSPSEATEILFAASTTAIIMAAPPPTSAEAFCEFAISERLLNEADKPKVFRFAQHVDRQRSVISAYIEETQLTSSVLPMLTDLSTAVELRFAFDKESNIRRAVPILTVHFDTDTKEELWLQLGTSRLEKLIAEFQTALAQMKSVVAWYSKRQGPSE